MIRRGFFSKLLLIIIALVLILLIFIFRVKENREILFAKLKGSSTSIKGELSQIAVFTKVEPHTKAFIIGSSLALWQENKITFISSENEILNDREVKFDEPEICEGIGRCAIFGKGEREVFLFNGKGERISIIKTENPAVFFKDFGDYVGIIERGDKGEYLEILTPDGKHMFSVFADLKHIGDFYLDKKNERLVYTEFFIGNGSLKSRLCTTDFQGKLLSEISMDELPLEISGEAENLAVVTQNDLIFIEGEKQISLYEDILNNEEKSSAGKIVGADFNKKIGLLTENKLIEADYKGKIITTSHSLNEAKIKPYGDGFLVSGDKGFVIIENGKILLKERGTFSDVVTDGNIIITFSEEGARWYEVKYVPE